MKNKVDAEQSAAVNSQQKLATPAMRDVLCKHEKENPTHKSKECCLVYINCLLR
jgi:hypothetical protein